MLLATRLRRTDWRTSGILQLGKQYYRRHGPRRRQRHRVNGSDGVFVASGTGNAILSNSIHDNTGLGIHLANGGNDNQAAGPDLRHNNGAQASPSMAR